MSISNFDEMLRQPVSPVIAWLFQEMCATGVEVG
jgi:hypothetical protein